MARQAPRNDSSHDARHGIDMWIVVNEDSTTILYPVHRAAAPYAGGRDYSCSSTPAKRLRKIAITGFSEENLKNFRVPDEPVPPTKSARLYEQYKPKKSRQLRRRRGVERRSRTTPTTHRRKMVRRSTAFRSAADLMKTTSTRIPEEFATYTAMVQLTIHSCRRYRANHPSQQDHGGRRRRWLYDSFGKSRGTWFQPTSACSARVRKRHVPRISAVASRNRDRARRPVHLDSASPTWTEYRLQKMAYVLLPARRRLRRLEKRDENTTRCRTRLRSARRAPASGRRVYNQTMEEMKQKGSGADLQPSHRQQGHARPSIDFRPRTEATSALQRPSLSQGAYLSVELNTQTAVPSGWQKVYI